MLMHITKCQDWTGKDCSRYYILTALFGCLLFANRNVKRNFSMGSSSSDLSSLDLVQRENQWYFGWHHWRPLQPTTITVHMKHIYRLHNVCMGYVLYRALVNHVMVMLCHTISKKLLIAESCNYTWNDSILYEIRDTLEYWEDPVPLSKYYHSMSLAILLWE